MSKCQIVGNLMHWLNYFKKDNRLRLNGWVYDNLQSTMNAFSEVIYFQHVEIMVNLDDYNSIKLET